MPRPSICGSDSGPEAPFPLRVAGKVIEGFGRGSKELGIPTANIPVAGLTVGGQKDVESGVYFGWVGLISPGSNEATTYPMVMSIGWNLFYKNTKRSVEVHIMHEFKEDFYDSHLNLVILGFIRPEIDYDSVDALIGDIRMDIEVAKNSLDRTEWKRWKDDDYLSKKPTENDIVT